MSQLKNDPERLRDYIENLNSHCGFWVQSIDELSDLMHRLSNSWRDDQFEEFKFEVDALKNELDKYSEVVLLLSNRLENDAIALDRYKSIEL